jgi:hypothetical protein
MDGSFQLHKDFSETLYPIRALKYNISKGLSPVGGRKSFSTWLLLLSDVTKKTEFGIDGMRSSTIIWKPYWIHGMPCSMREGQIYHSAHRGWNRKLPYRRRMRDRVFWLLIMHIIGPTAILDAFRSFVYESILLLSSALPMATNQFPKRAARSMKISCSYVIETSYKYTRLRLLVDKPGRKETTRKTKT